VGTIKCNVELNDGWRVAAIDVGASPLWLLELRRGSSPGQVFARIDLDKGALLDRAHLGAHSIDQHTLLSKVLNSAREMRLKCYPQGHRVETTPPPPIEDERQRAVAPEAVAEPRSAKRSHRRSGR